MLLTGFAVALIVVFSRQIRWLLDLARQVEQVLKSVPGTSSAYAERIIGGYYLDIVPNRDSIARYGLMISDVQDVIATALGGDAVTTTVIGLT